MKRLFVLFVFRKAARGNPRLTGEPSSFHSPESKDKPDWSQGPWPLSALACC